MSTSAGETFAVRAAELAGPVACADGLPALPKCTPFGPTVIVVPPMLTEKPSRPFGVTDGMPGSEPGPPIEPEPPVEGEGAAGVRGAAGVFGAAASATEAVPSGDSVQTSCATT